MTPFHDSRVAFFSDGATAAETGSSLGEDGTTTDFFKVADGGELFPGTLGTGIREEEMGEFNLDIKVDDLLGL